MYRIRRSFRQIRSMSRRALHERPYSIDEGRLFFDTLLTASLSGWQFFCIALGYIPIVPEMPL